MDSNDTYLRVATPDDAQSLLSIYIPYVEKTVITFEYTSPTLAEFKGRIEATLRKYPYLVAVNGNEISGYAYTGAFRSREAYGWSAETTVYVREDKRRLGLGRKLYKALEEISRTQGITNLYACIGYPETEDEYLTMDSVRFHERMGYTSVGEYHKCGYKFGRWYNMVMMEKMLCSHTENQPPVIPFPDLDICALKLIQH